jgi:DNA-binding phage protein
MTIKGAIVEAIGKDARSNYRIAKDAGITPKTLYKLLGGGNITVDAADKLSRTLGMTFRPLIEAERCAIAAKRANIAKVAKDGRN